MSRRHMRHLHKFFDADAEGPVESVQARRRRLKAAAKDGKKAVQIERSPTAACLERAAKRLKTAGAEHRVLKVQQWHMKKAEEAMRKAGVTGVVSNLSGTRTKRVGQDKTDKI